MAATQLTGRGILIVLLIFVVFMGGVMSLVFLNTWSPTGPKIDWGSVGVSASIAILAAVWLVRLCYLAIRDWRLGVTRAPAKVGAKFHIWFGAIVALGGIAATALTYHAAIAAGGGIYTFYYGMIAWGGIELFVGLSRIGLSK